MEIDFYAFQATHKALPEEVPIEKDTGPSPFDITNNLNNTKGGYDPLAVGYIPWLVNKALSFQSENIYRANELNIHGSELPNYMQFDYYWHGIPRGNHWGAKWTKFKITEDERAVMDYFQFNYEKAKYALKILKKDQVKLIKEFLKSAKG